MNLFEDFLAIAISAIDRLNYRLHVADKTTVVDVAQCGQQHVDPPQLTAMHLLVRNDFPIVGDRKVLLLQHLRTALIKLRTGQATR